jgi:hypothetical protein
MTVVVTVSDKQEGSLPSSFPRLFSSVICLSGTCGDFFIEAISAFLDFT